MRGYHKKKRKRFVTWEMKIADKRLMSTLCLILFKEKERLIVIYVCGKKRGVDGGRG